MNSVNQYETATLGNGCFWCTEAIFMQLKGVIKVQSGYSGGTTINPDYKSVCSGTTGHAECLNITFDSSIISFDELLTVFWKTHDPTSLNKQGEDIGTQYRSVIFYHNDSQLQLAKDYIQQLTENKIYEKGIVTTLEPMINFYPAEDYHQNYLALNGQNPYCQVVVRPKVEKFKKEFTHLL
jgi:peptide-methionine (S)-S-oxide reductase